MAYGTYSVLDGLATFDAQNVLDYGEDRLLQDFQRSLAAHNALVDDMIDPLVETTTDRVRRYGVESRLSMIEADEYTRADAQKAPLLGVDIGFPLRSYQLSLQWTRKYLQIATPAQLAATMQAAQRADIANVRVAVQRALFTPTNTLTYKDRMIDGVTIPLRALLNADGAAIPENDFGVTFDGATHTHFLATASLVAANIESLLDTVIEHGVTGPIFLYINRAQEAAVSGMANFDAYIEPRLQRGGGFTGDLTDQDIRPFDIYNRAIGVWNGAVEVWVKSWIPASYLLAVEVDPGRRVLARRRRAGASNMDALQIVANDEHYPLRAETMEREFGVSVWGREQAAALFTGGGAYVVPTFTA